MQTNQFVVLYNHVSNIKANKLDMIDVYIYAFLKTYMNKDTKKATISLHSLSEKSEVNKITITKSLQKLKDLKYIKFSAVANVCTTYEFIKSDDGFERIPYILLFTDLLNYREKAYAICIQQYLFNTDFENNIKSIEEPLNNYTLYSPTKLAELLGISDTTTLKYTDSLKEKGFIIKQKSLDKKNSLWVFNYKLLYKEGDKIISKIKEDRDVLLQEKDLEIKQHLKTIKMLKEQIANSEKLVEKLSIEILEIKNLKTETE